MESFLSTDNLERACLKTNPRLGPRGLALVILGVSALWGGLLAALSWASLSRQQQTYRIASEPSKLHQGGEPALHDGRYPIYQDAIGAYITCPLDSPDVAHQAGCTFDVLFHGYIPNPCIDHDVYQYWHRDRVGDLEWRESEESPHPIAKAEILRDDVAKYPTAWAPTTVHYYHCLYLFNGSSRAQSRLSPLVLDTHLD
ncbi:hypothetical protein PG996_006034 [Apiospora saccharicola]|uniref:Uncharacterized protein n=1 Tax=Apiospora saccharicola TaxID=335842 RepID=A0ABR1VN57_9PEZI